jgi:hypothetical protein
MSCLVMHLFALYLLFLPPLLSGRLQDWRCSRVRLRPWRPAPFSRASRQAKPPWSFLYRPFSLPLMLALDFATVVRWHLFWCIAWFCNLLLILYLLCYMLSIGWLVIHQWPRTLVRVARLYYRKIRSRWSMCRDRHITAHPLSCTTLQSYYRVPRVIPPTSLLMISL